MSDGSSARADWQARIGQRSDDAAIVEGYIPPAPVGLRAEAGRGQVTLRWRHDEQAMGYLVHKGPTAQGPWEPLDHHGNDVLAVPTAHYADTTGRPEEPRWYAVAAIGDLDTGPGPLSQPVEAAPLAGGDAVVAVTVECGRDGGRLRRLWHMLGSERLSQLRDPGVIGGVPIADDFAAAIALARDELGLERIRAHAILHDDVGVYRESGGEPVLDFTTVDAIYDQLLDIGVRPVVELGFMPRDLASDPSATVFAYKAGISPPRDWDRWTALVETLVIHLVARYGIDEVAGWGFEVWNEPNLEVFWSGTRDDYWRLYATAAEAVKRVDDRLLVGGPASAAAGWIEPFIAEVSRRGLPLDFLSTHTYGNLPLNMRPVLRRHNLEDVRIWWTEWGVTPNHFSDVTDAPFGAPFVLHGMKISQRRVDQLAYWVVSDQFEELGRPDAFLHGGFGLLTIGNLRKPRYLALQLAEQLDDALCAVDVSGDGAGSLVDAWASRSAEGRVDVLVWNGTLDQSKAAGAEALDRTVTLCIKDVDTASAATITRVDADHANIAALVDDKAAWPDPQERESLQDRAALIDEPYDVEVGRDGSVSTEFTVPMPGVVRLRVEPRA